jgi:hypothetical protein
MAQAQVGELRRAPDPLDARMRLLDHLHQDRRGEVGQLHGLQARLQALDRVEVGAQADSCSTTSRDRWVFNRLGMAVLRWPVGRPTAGWPFHG